MDNKICTLGFLLIAVCASIPAHAERPSFTSLQQQINQLNAEVNTLQAQVDQQPRQPVLLDSANTIVGDVLTIDFNSDTLDSGSAVISVAPDSGLEANIYYNPGQGFAGASVLYDQERCQGNIVGIQRLGGLLTLSGAVSNGRPPTGMTVHVPDTSSPASSIQHVSDGSGSLCRTVALPNTLTTVGYPLLQTIDMSEAGFVPPYRIVAAP